MKILMVNSFHYLRGGAERCFFDLTHLLESHGHEVVPFCMQHPLNMPSKYEEYFVDYVDFPTELAKPGLAPKLNVARRVIYSTAARDSIEALLEATEPDIAHVHGIAHETSPSVLPAIKAAGLPVVQTLHDYKLLCPNTSFLSNGEVCERCKTHRYYNVVRYRCKRGSLPASVLAGLETSIHKATQIYERNVDLFISPSQFLLNKLREYGIKNRAVNIPNFIDLDRFSPNYEAGDYFVYIGRLSKEKGLLTLLKAMKEVGRSHLYIAGRGEQEPELRAFVTQNGLNNITFLGHLPTEELAELLRKASFAVTPSQWYENYSMSVLEALASGTPVIGSRIGGIPEQVLDGWNGFLFEPGNHAELAEKINTLLDNEALRKAMARNARARIEELNGPQTHYEQTMACYHEVLRSPAADQTY